MSGGEGVKKERKNAGNLSQIRLDEKYAVKSYWFHPVNHVVILRQIRERENRMRTLDDLAKEPEPGIGLDGYPLQRGKGGPGCG